MTFGDGSAVLTVELRGLPVTPMTVPTTSRVVTVSLTLVRELASGAVATLLTKLAAGVSPTAGAIAVLTAETALFEPDWTGLFVASTTGATVLLTLDTVPFNPVWAVVAVLAAVLAAVDAVGDTLLTPSAMPSMKEPLMLLVREMPARPVALYKIVCVALTVITG